MMKKMIFTLVAIAAFTACSTTPNSGEYNLVGVATDAALEGTTIYMAEFASSEFVDSAVVKEGEFAFEGKLDHPAVIRVISEAGQVMAATENGVVELTIDSTMRVTAGGESMQIAGIRQPIDDAYMEFMNFYKANPTDREAAMQKYEDFQALSDQLLSEGLAANGDNLVGAYCVAALASKTETVAELDSLIALALLSKDLYTVVRNRTNKVNAERTVAGKMFVDFKGSDLSGNASSLSDYVGKGNYVLVDFWASWCGPCRAEMPNLRKVYDKHKENGLVLLGVNVCDKKDACIKAIEEEQMSWPILYASDNTNATDSYGILGIPTIILFAPDGTIVDREARGAEIMTLIDGVYNK